MGENIPAGWYSDPAGNGGWRWWDGGRWTDVTTEAPASVQASVGNQQVDPGLKGSDPPGQADDGSTVGGRRRGSVVAGVVLVGLMLVGVGTGLGVWVTGSSEPVSEPDAPE